MKIDKEDLAKRMLMEAPACGLTKSEALACAEVALDWVSGKLDEDANEWAKLGDEAAPSSVLRASRDGIAAMFRTTANAFNPRIERNYTVIEMLKNGDSE